MRAFLVAVALACAACTPPASHDAAPAASVAGIEVRDPWAGPTPSGVDVSAGYLTIRNTGGEADRLISAESPRAARVEVHEMIMDGAVMRMRAAEVLVIAGGEENRLAPGGQHLMFYDVTSPFVEGEQIPVRLRFERAGEIDISLPVRRPEREQLAH